VNLPAGYVNFPANILKTFAGFLSRFKVKEQRKLQNKNQMKIRKKRMWRKSAENRGIYRTLLCTNQSI
jgi:hypothetical protein